MKREKQNWESRDECYFHLLQNAELRGIVTPENVSRIIKTIFIEAAAMVIIY